jgi:hypothetical protein
MKPGSNPAGCVEWPESFRGHCRVAEVSLVVRLSPRTTYGSFAGRTREVMAKTLYCWRCKMEVPMLEEHEWEQISPRLSDAVKEIQDYRRAHSASLHEAKDRIYGEGALDRYFEMTGFRETNVNALWHHRLSRVGPPCSTCGKPLRTPRAKLCAACGSAVGLPTEVTPTRT